jgi:hypothetical protein
MQTPPTRPAAEWRTLALDPANDTPIYRSPRNGPEENGPAPDRGTDLFAHTAQSGSVYYYLWHWSHRSNETNICQLTTEDSAKQFIREQCGGSASVTGLDNDAPEVHLPGKDRAVVKWD